MTYKKRSLKFQFTLKEGSFDDKGNNILTLDNIKAEVEVGAYGGVTGTSLEARIFGLSLNNMALLSFKGIQYNGAKQSMVKIWADDKPIFIGSITNAFADLNQMPDAPLIISAFSTGFERSISSPPFSMPGSVKVSDIITSIAKSINFTVINNNVKSTLENPYYEGNPIDQMLEVARGAGINIDFRLGAVYIWNQDGSVDETTPLVSPRNGLIGYPVFGKSGISFTAQYSELLLRGRKVKLETSLPNGTGTYTIQSAVHHLSSWIEGGPWSTMVWASIGEITPVRQ